MSGVSDSLFRFHSGPPESDPRTDAELVYLAARGDTQCFDALYARHQAWVGRMCLRFTNDEAAALDVFQETWAYFVRRLPTLKLTSKLTTFLYPAIKNLAATGGRKRLRLASDDTMESAAGASREPAPPDVVARIGTSPIEEAVKALPEGQREVVLLRFVDDMSLGEIAAALDVPIGTVKSRLHGAIQTLRADPRVGELFA
ncbi:MAG: sigma-70 family RNA polymerase sigma factor [Planctomycetota bacterium]|nr:sigma-70 family RNA polymerase sigma factor [Planctomycetota bacterium]